MEWPAHLPLVRGGGVSIIKNHLYLHSKTKSKSLHQVDSDCLLALSNAEYPICPLQYLHG